MSLLSSYAKRIVSLRYIPTTNAHQLASRLLSLQRASALHGAGPGVFLWSRARPANHHLESLCGATDCVVWRQWCREKLCAAHRLRAVVEKREKSGGGRLSQLAGREFSCRAKIGRASCRERV